MDDSDRPLIYLNEGFFRLTGYSSEEVLGKNCRFLQGKDTEEAPINEIRRAISAGEETTVELLNYKKDGTPFWNRLSISPLKDPQGKVTHYVGIQSDITELRETKRGLEIANDSLADFHQRINFELDQANKVQEFILPAELPNNDQISFHSLYKPMGKIGGDYYDIIELDKGIYGMLVADVTGHGIPAALLTFMASFAFKNSAPRISSTAHVIRETNEKLSNRMPRGSFITMFYAIYDADSREMTFTQAGHPEGMILRVSTNEIISLQSEGSLVGAFENDQVTFGESKVLLEPGDKVIIFTDALIEARNLRGEMITMEAIHTLIMENKNDSLDLLFEKLYQFGKDFTEGRSFEDDFTLLGFEVK